MIANTTTQYILLVRTASYQDARSPFIDVTAVARQRELRHERDVQQRKSVAAKAQQHQQRNQSMAAQARDGVRSPTQQQQHQQQQPSSQKSKQRRAVAMQLGDGADSGGDDDDDGGSVNPKAAELSMQQLLSPDAMLGAFCIVTGAAQVAEHFLRAFENQMLSERARKAALVAARGNGRAAGGATSPTTTSANIAKDTTAGSTQQQQRDSPARYGNKSATATTTDGGDGGVDDGDHDDRASPTDAVLDPSTLQARFDRLLPADDALAAPFPLHAIPAHFQYHGGLVFEFVDALPVCCVLELREDANGVEEPRYVAHGATWVKALLLQHMEGRATAMDGAEG